MDRRSFARSGVAALLGTGTLPRWASAQATPPVLQYHFVDVANTFARAVSSISRGTPDAPKFNSVLDDIFTIIRSGLIGEFGVAKQIAKQLDSRKGDLTSTVARLVETQKPVRVPEFNEYFSGMLIKLPDDVSRWEKRDAILVRVFPQTIKCVVSAFWDQRQCLTDELWKPVFSCGLAALPGLRVGWPGYLAAFGACLIDDLPDLTTDIVTKCIGPLKLAIGKCERPSA